MSSTKKLVVVGDGACGKTCLLVVFSKNEFPEDYIPTIYDLYFKKLEIDDSEIEFALWDTAGEEEYDRLRPLAYPRTNVVLICFSVDNPDSFINVKEKWAPEVKHFCSHVPVILVANKLDLRYNPDIQSHLKKTNLETVKYNQGLKMAKKIKADDYVECSAKTMEGVTQVFTSAARAALRTKKLCRNRICKML